MALTFLDGNTATSPIPGWSGQLIFPEVMDKHTYKLYRSIIKAESTIEQPEDDEDMGYVYMTDTDPETGQSKEEMFFFSHKVARIGMKLARFEGFAPERVARLGAHNPDGDGVPITLMAWLSRATADWVGRQLSFRLDSSPELPQ